MEDIDKDKDGQISLEEYIGKRCEICLIGVAFTSCINTLRDILKADN